MMYGIGLHIPYLETIDLYKVIQLATERGNNITYFYQQPLLVGWHNEYSNYKQNRPNGEKSWLFRHEKQRGNTSAVPPHQRDSVMSGFAQDRLGEGNTVEL